MDKKIIKDHLSKRFLSEEVTPGISVTNKVKKDNAKVNKDGVKSVEKDSIAYNKSLKQDKDTSKMAPNKYSYDDKFEKTYHDEMEIMNGQEMLQYDSKPDSRYVERAFEAIEGSAKMGNQGGIGNAQATWGASSDDFGKNLVKRIKASTNKRSEETPTLNLRGRDIQADLKDTGHRPYAIEENNKTNNNNPQIKESMKRLKFKNEFKGVGNALKLIPEGYRVDNKTFEMTDGNETYRIRWEGNLSEGKAVVLTASDKKMVNEDIKRMKELFGYKSQDTLGLVKGNARINENKVFGDIWNKSKELLSEEDIESTNAKESNWEETSKKAPEATKHVQGKTSTDKGMSAPKAKEGDLDKAVSQAPESKKHMANGSAKATDKAKQRNWDEVSGGEKQMETETSAPKQGHWEDTKMSHAPEAKKHVKMNENYREGVYGNFNEWKNSFPKGTNFEQKNNYVVAIDSTGKELGKWNPVSIKGMHADDFQYKNLEENWYGFSFIGANGKESRKLMANDDEDFKKRAKDWLQKNGLDPNGIQSYKELDQDEANKTKEVSNESYNNEEIMEKEDLMKQIEEDMKNMRMNEFGDGSNYAPGTENDPNSPWNQSDEEEEEEEEDGEGEDYDTYDDIEEGSEESGEEEEEEEDNWNKPEDDDSSNEKEPTVADIKKTGIPIGIDDEDDEDDIQIPLPPNKPSKRASKNDAKLLFSPSSGQYWISVKNDKFQVPDEYLSIASDSSRKGSEKAALIIKKIEAANIAADYEDDSFEKTDFGLDEYGMEHNEMDINGDGKVDAEDTKLAGKYKGH